METKLKTLEALVSESTDDVSISLVEKTKKLEEENSQLKKELSNSQKETENLKNRLEVLESKFNSISSTQQRQPPSTTNRLLHHHHQDSPSRTYEPSDPNYDSTPQLSPASSSSSSPRSEGPDFSLFPPPTIENHFFNYPFSNSTSFSTSKVLMESNGHSLVAREFISQQRKVSSIRSKLIS
jgi:hypothetical protein